MSDLTTLLTIDAISQLKARYFRCMDAKDWRGFRAVFTPDALFDVRGALAAPNPDTVYAEPPISGVDAIVSYVSTGLQGITSVHHGHMPEIEVVSADEARGIWAMSDLLVAPEGAALRMFRGAGHYHETYRKTAAGWQIASLRLQRLWVEMR